VGLLGKVIDQTDRRIFKGERVPASEKIVSFFEDHTEIIVKKRRETEYGLSYRWRLHMILDCLMYAANRLTPPYCTGLLLVRQP
jgi:IS5 family transposase